MQMIIILCAFPRYVPSQADVAVFEAVGGTPDVKLVNALRWYNHIQSYSSDDKLA